MVLRPGRRAAAAAAALVLLAAPAQALDRRIRIVNGSRHAIVEFTATRFGDRPSEEDRLGDDGLPAGKSVVLDFEDGSGYCRFVFRAVFDDGKSLTKASVNVCEVGTFRYTE